MTRGYSAEDRLGTFLGIKSFFDSLAGTLSIPGYRCVRMRIRKGSLCVFFLPSHKGVIFNDARLNLNEVLLPQIRLAMV